MRSTDERQPWAAVDEYLGRMFAPPDPVLAATLEASDAAGLPAIGVTPLQGRLLMVLASAVNARRVLEIGTLGGYSTIWLARGCGADGTVVSIENEPRHFETAAANIVASGVRDRVDLRFGSALDILPQLEAEAAGPYDLVFIDADKRRYAEFFRAALPLTRRGTLIIADNVVRQGGVADPGNTDENVLGIRRFFDAIANEPRVTATVVQTVGAKGHDGWAVAVVA